MSRNFIYKNKKKDYLPIKVEKSKGFSIVFFCITEFKTDIINGV